MLIGEVAAQSGLSAKTLRYYEDIGLVAPTTRLASGYRHFDETVFDRLAFIRSSQSLGLTLGEIRGIVALRERGEVPCGHVTDLLCARAADIEQTIRQLCELQSELRRLVERAKRLDPADCEPLQICHLIGAERAPA